MLMTTVIGHGHPYPGASSSSSRVGRSVINLHKRQITRNLLDAFEVSELLEELLCALQR